jgi:predicted transcriptional regulator
LRKALLGRSFDKEQIEKMRISNTVRVSVLITNTETGNKLEFPSMTEAGKYLGISRHRVKRYLLKNTPYKEYTIYTKNPDLSLKNENTRVAQQAVLLTNKETGDIKEFCSMVDAAKYLNISRKALRNYLDEIVKTGSKTIKGFTISKIANINKVSKSAKKIEVTDIKKNEVTIYSSMSLAGKALGVRIESLSRYLANKQTKPFKNKYILKLVY